MPSINAPEGCWQHFARGWNFLDSYSDVGQLLEVQTRLPWHSLSELQSPSPMVHFSSSEQHPLLYLLQVFGLQLGLPGGLQPILLSSLPPVPIILYLILRSNMLQVLKKPCYRRCYLTILPLVTMDFLKCGTYWLRSIVTICSTCLAVSFGSMSGKNKIILNEIVHCLLDFISEFIEETADFDYL